MTKGLTVPERSQLRRLTAIVKDGLRTFVQVGNALKEIRDGKLYRETHQTFEAFCASEFDVGKSQAYRLIEAAQVKSSPIGDKIANENQARQMASVPEKHRATVIASVEKSGKPLTGAAIKKAAAEIVPLVPIKVETDRQKLQTVAVRYLESAVRAIDDLNEVCRDNKLAQQAVDDVQSVIRKVKGWNIG